jgi:hypothetical protein
VPRAIVEKWIERYPLSFQLLNLLLSRYPPGRFCEEGFVLQWKALALADEALSWMEL